MADFDQAFEIMMRNEGGYTLHQVAGDRGGQTYAGIARHFNPGWRGWVLIDQQGVDSPMLSQAVRDFYAVEFWQRISGDQVESQPVANSIFDFAVNAGVKTVSKLVQVVVGSTPDGVIGAKTIARINTTDSEKFILKFSLAKVARYAQICNRDRSQRKFLLGWMNRTIAGLS
ncbi:MAG: N-acetylmuramidase [Gammaproteobacteria bacterium]|nr:N-acetylmuramidase [Gammaproteobacteria bacterium]